MCCLDIFVDLQPLGGSLKGDLLISLPRFGGLGETCESGIGPSDSPHIGSYLLSVGINSLSLADLELFSWLQKRFRPSAGPTRIR